MASSPSSRGWGPGPYLGFFVCGGKLGFREISDQYSYKKQPSKIRHYVRKKTFSFPGGGNCPLRPPAMYGPGDSLAVKSGTTKRGQMSRPRSKLQHFSLIAQSSSAILSILSCIYTEENVWRGLDESGTRTKKIVLITHLHVLFSTVLNDVKL